jgi:hypothetical protein
MRKSYMMEELAKPINVRNQIIKILLFLLFVILIIVLSYRSQILNNYYSLLRSPIGKYKCEMMEYEEIWAGYTLELFSDGTAKYSMGDYSKTGTWLYTEKTKILVISNMGNYKFISVDSMYEVNDDGNVNGMGTSCDRIK